MNAGPVRNEPRARFGDLLAAEWHKLWTLRSTAWAIIGGAVLIPLMSVLAAVTDYVNFPEYPDGIKENFFPSWSSNDAFSDGSAWVMLLLLGSIGAVIVAGEYSSGMIRANYAAVPRRRQLMAAKLTVVTALFTVWGAVVAVVAFFSSQAILDGRGVGIDIDYPGALRLVLGSAMLAPVSVIAGMAIAAILRGLAASIVTTIGVTLLAPVLMNSQRDWVIRVQNLFPISAWRRLSNIDPDGSSWFRPAELTVGGAWMVYAVWVVAAIVVGVLVVRRDP
ncbi:hypothetical protein Afil01_47760 [Actinorhabdospora filicis]|uniref:ABC transporter permease n=2 Tax=Actinorhabdospora filicis TaxID=1785913 RepID=A0A9W6WAT2_9ACTN|nr:hypothetical protein Afil01_47760 [Actinorhabdospora filicis]